MFASLGLSPQEGRRDFLLVGFVSMFIEHANLLKMHFLLFLVRLTGEK